MRPSPTDYVDHLTGLLDRRWLQLCLEAEESDVLVVIDLDDFGLMNDTIGFDAGDDLLRAHASRLSALADQDSTLARIGDDEFGILLGPGVDPIAWAEQAREALGLPVMIAGRPHAVTASLGIAVAEPHGLGPNELLPAADRALQRAKERGGARVEMFDPVLLERSRRRALLEQELRRGLEARQFTVYYQPQVSMVTGLISGAEALVRWEHPSEGLIYPDAFIPIAEQTLLIRELGAFVLDRACRDAVAFLEDRRHDGPFTISVNVSTVQLQDTGFVGIVTEALSTSGLPPDALCLELTESAILGDSLRTEAILGHLGELGVRFSIDDFGTGYSSLSYLRRLPVAELKIDRSFIIAMGNPQGDAMVAAICGIAAALDVELVAEGVDDEGVIGRLRAWGCDIVQGYLYFKPGPVDQITKAIRRDKPRSLPDPSNRTFVSS